MRVSLWLLSSVIRSQLIIIELNHSLHALAKGRWYKGCVEHLDVVLGRFNSKGRAGGMLEGWFAVCSQKDWGHRPWWMLDWKQLTKLCTQWKEIKYSKINIACVSREAVNIIKRETKNLGEWLKDWIVYWFKKGQYTGRLRSCRCYIGWRYFQFW